MHRMMTGLSWRVCGPHNLTPSLSDILNTHALHWTCEVGCRVGMYRRSVWGGGVECPERGLGSKRDRTEVDTRERKKENNRSWVGSIPFIEKNFGLSSSSPSTHHHGLPPSHLSLRLTSFLDMSQHTGHCPAPLEPCYPIPLAYN